MCDAVRMRFEWLLTAVSPTSAHFRNAGSPVYPLPMKLLLFLLTVWLGIASAAEPQRTLGVTPASGGKRVALIIGNAAYPGVAALKNSANDAKDIGEKLKKLGFDVTVRTDIRYREMLRSLTEFGDKIQPGTEALFFYAGHGMQVRGRNFLIPLDAEIRTESSVSSEAVDVDQLLDKLAPARLSMVILDACRNNPFERRFRGGGQGLASINAPTGTLIAYATAPGKVASDGDGRNGLYTQELLAAMDIPGIKVEDVFKRVRTNVIRKSGEAQTPWESSSLTGDFFFSDNGVTTTSMPSSRVQSEAEIEQEFWDTVKNSDRQADIRNYVSRYPQGRFAALAFAKIESLGRNSPQAEVTKALKVIQLNVGEQLDKVSIYPMKVCNYARPVSSILDESVRRLAPSKAPGIDVVGDSAGAVLSIRPTRAILAKAAGSESDYVNTMTMAVESRLSIGERIVMNKTYESRSTSKYATCCTCSAWDPEIDSELKKLVDDVVSKLLGDLVSLQVR